MRIGRDMVQQLKDKKVICQTCGCQETLMIKLDEYTTYKCACGTKIYYPPNRDREYSVVKFIPILEARINEHIENNKIEVKNKVQYVKIYNEFREKMQLKPECDLFYERFVKREHFKKAVMYGGNKK